MDRNAIIQAFINDLNYVDGLNLPLEMPAQRVHYLAMALRDYSFDCNRVISADDVERIVRDAVSEETCDLESSIVDRVIDRIFKADAPEIHI